MSGGPGWPLACSPRGARTRSTRGSPRARAVLRLKRGLRIGSVVGATIATYALVVDAVIADVAEHRALTVGLENVDSAETRVPPPERVLARFRAAAEAQARHAAASSGATKPVVVPGRTPMDASGSPPPPAPSSSTPAAEASASNVDVYGRAYGACKATAECPICVQKTAASRFAQHLERCMGKGRVAARAAAVAGAGTGFYPGGILSRIARRDAVRREEAMKIETERRTAAEKERAEKERAVRTAAKRAKTAEGATSGGKNASGRSGKPGGRWPSSSGTTEGTTSRSRDEGVRARREGDEDVPGAGAGPGGADPKPPPRDGRRQASGGDGVGGGQTHSPVRERRRRAERTRAVAIRPRRDDARRVEGRVFTGTELALNAALRRGGAPNTFGGNNSTRTRSTRRMSPSPATTPTRWRSGRGGRRRWNPQPARRTTRARPGIPGIQGWGGGRGDDGDARRSAPGMYPGMMPREGVPASRRRRGHAQRQPSAMFARVFERRGRLGRRRPPGADARRRGGFPGVPPRRELHGGASLLPGRGASGSSRGDPSARGAAEARGRALGAGRARRGRGGDSSSSARRRRRSAPSRPAAVVFPPGRRARARGTLSTRTRRPRASARARGCPWGRLRGADSRAALVRVFVMTAAGRAPARARPRSRSGGRARGGAGGPPRRFVRRVFHADVPMDGGRDGGGDAAPMWANARGIREAKLIHAEGDSFVRHWHGKAHRRSRTAVRAPPVFARANASSLVLSRMSPRECVSVSLRFAPLRSASHGTEFPEHRPPSSSPRAGTARIPVSAAAAVAARAAAWARSAAAAAAAADSAARPASRGRSLRDVDVELDRDAVSVVAFPPSSTSPPSGDPPALPHRQHSPSPHESRIRSAYFPGGRHRRVHAPRAR